MAVLEDSIAIKATSEQVFEGLIKVFSSKEYYRTWHNDHVDCRWIRGASFEEGSMLYVEEYLHGELHQMKFRTSQFEPNRRIDYKLLFPMSLISPKGSFAVEPREGLCVFTATLTFRFGGFFMKIASKRVEALKKHMREEGENLKRLLERGGQS